MDRDKLNTANEGRPDCFEVRCPDCETLATMASNGSFISHKCRSCKGYFTGMVVGGVFVCYEGNTRRRPIMQVGPPTLVG